MLTRFMVLLSIVCVGAAFAPGASTVGSVSSAGTFVLRGAAVPADGVPNWPVMTGDEIATQSSPATISFKDGSRAIIAPNSRASIESVDGSTILRLTSGAMDVKVSQTPAIRFYVRSAPISAGPGSTATASTPGKGALSPRRVLTPPPGPLPPPVSNR